jgi:RAB6A-GEF complex partner protein 1
LPKSYLFLQHILLHHLEDDQVTQAVSFASYYKNLVFFAHSLEMLLHTVVESDFTAVNNDVEGTDSTAILPTVAEFLDHFDASLDVVVGCARKTELTRWPHLFNVLGTPKSLFEVNLST